MAVELQQITKEDTKKSLQDRFKFSGGLTRKKLFSYIPVMIMTNISTLLLVSVDGLVVGNFLGEDALSSVNIFYPITLFISLISIVIAYGIGTAFSTSMGNNNIQEITRLKAAGKRLMIISAAVSAIVQIPMVYIIINAYNLSDNMKQLVWSYAVGVMISMPFGLISLVGVVQLQIMGKMKVLMYLSAMEGLVNLVLDIFFVGVIRMGVAGAGWGTAASNILRSMITVIYLAKKTDIYKSEGAKPEIKDYKSIIAFGLPDTANSLMLAIQNFFMMKIILSVFGDAGGTIKGVCAFTVSLALVLINGVQGAMRPMNGLLCGAKDWKGLRILMKQGIVTMLVLIGIMAAVVEAVPSLFYHLHGVKDIPEFGLIALRINGLHFAVRGANSIFRLYFANRKETRFATVLTIVGNTTLPIFAFCFSKLVPGPLLWLSYLLTETIILVVNIRHYLRIVKRDKKEADEDVGIIYLSVKPSEAVEASRAVRKYADDIGYEERIANRIALCLEEMTHYTETAQNGKELNIQILIKLRDKNALFVMLDDGKCISLDKDIDKQELITDNYELIKRVAKRVEYQYILNLNYTVLEFTSEKLIKSA